MKNYPVCRTCRNRELCDYQNLPCEPDLRDRRNENADSKPDKV